MTDPGAEPSDGAPGARGSAPGEDPLLRETLDRIGIEPSASDDPEGPARRRAAAAALQPDSLVLVPSVGLGHGLRFLLARLPPGCAVVCVEVDERVMGLAVARGLPSDPRLTILRTTDEGAVIAALRALGPRRFRRVIEVPLSAGYRLDPERYRRFRAALEGEMAAGWRNRMTLIALGSRLVRNLFANLPLLAASGDAGSLATELPVVVAGAGPSLEAALPALSACRRRFLLAACDTALPCLAAAGLVPDVVVALEAQHANLADFLPCRDPSIRLACELAAWPGVPRQLAGRVWFFSSDFAPVALLDRLAEAGLRPRAVPPLGSVGVAAAFLALQMTSAPVVLSGLDFSFPGGMTHARGAPAALSSLAGSGRLSPPGQAAFAALRARTLLLRQGWHGPVATDAVLLGYRDTLASIVEPQRSRIYEVAGEGIPCGATPVAPRELPELLGLFPQPRGARPWGAVGGEPGPPSADRRTRVAEFLEGEERLLDEGIRVARGLLDPRAGGRRPEAEERATLAALDYAWLAFPDQTDLDAPDRSFLARLLPWLGLYRQRASRAAAAARLPAVGPGSAA